MDCDDRGDGWRGWRGWRNRAHVCEIREQTLAATGELVVDAGQNGGVRVTGWDRDEVLVRAQVRAWGGDEEQARDIQRQVEVHTAGAIRAEGPSQRRRVSWTVGYEIFAPRQTDLTLDASNGGIVIDGVSGDIDFDTTNGGVRLDSLAGDVRGRTTNGGLDITLAGSTWDGEGLRVSATNGGVRLRVPENYSARLETKTVNGGVSIDFPITVQGRLGREVSTTLGDGGPLIGVSTTNGGVRVSSY